MKKPTLAEEYGFKCTIAEQAYIIHNIVTASTAMQDATSLEEWRYYADWWFVSVLVLGSVVTRDW